MANKINYTGSSKILQRICESLNDVIDNQKGLTMWKVSFYDSSGTTLLSREYVADGDDCTYGTQLSWSDEPNGSAVQGITSNITQNLSVYEATS